MGVLFAMRNPIKYILGIVAFAFALNAFDSAPVLADEHMIVIKERKALMKKVVKATRIIKKYKKGKASANEAIAAAKALRKAMNASIDKRLYPKNSTRPDVSAKKTRAKANILSEWEAFVEAGKKSAKLASKFIEVAKVGQGEAKFACGGCHKPYRGKKVR
tara:strand:+ start:239 stop:721 length:483 start_codon:yes stop_codon:yes gene_type:complete